MGGRWSERSLARERLVRGIALLLLGVTLAQAAIVGPASSCPRASLLRGGDMVPGFCADYGAASAGWPLLFAGLAGIALGVLLLHRAADVSRSPVVLRAALYLALGAAALLFGAWSEGAQELCAKAHDDPSGAPAGSCITRPEPWTDAALVAAGALAGAAFALAGVALRGARFR